MSRPIEFEKREEWIGPPEPELWRKVDGYDDGEYKWAVATADTISWHRNEREARAEFAKAGT